MQTITRKGNFDSAHRIMNHKGKCANLHGHTYIYELSIQFNEQAALVNMENIGYPIDFADLKTLAGGYIDYYYDHALIYNPCDTDLVAIAQNNPTWKTLPMWLKGEGKYCNPSVENIALQLYVELEQLFDINDCPFIMSNLRIYETPNSYADVNGQIMQHEVYRNLCDMASNLDRIKKWK